MNLYNSSVTFQEEGHIYHLGNRQLYGITGLIKSILGLGVYPDADAYAKDYTIPRAGSRGRAVHKAIEDYDALGEYNDTQVVKTIFGCEERNNITIEELTWNVKNELDAYIEHLSRYHFEPVANEYIVSDNKRFASQIDNVWRNKKTGGIWLADTKTNNINLYPLCGYYDSNYFDNRVDALKEYLSWQLSVYAYLFEQSNPGIKVEGLVCNWLRSDAHELWEIDRKDDNLIEMLLDSDVTDLDGDILYYNSRQDELLAMCQREHKAISILPDNVMDYITDVMARYEQAKAEMDKVKSTIQQAMREHNVISFNFGSFKGTIAKDSKVNKFDSERFKNDHPELYKEYLTQSTRKGGLTLKSNKK